MASVTRASSCSGVRPSGLTPLRALLDFLEEAGNADLDEFIQMLAVMARNLDALKKRVGDVARFFGHATIELKPLNMSVEVVAPVVEADSWHGRFLKSQRTRKDANSLLRADERGNQ